MEESVANFLEYQLLSIAYEKKDTAEKEINFSLGIEEQVNENNQQLRRIVLRLNLEGAAQGNIVLAGTFEIKDSYEEKGYGDSNALHVIGASILLPYARSILSFVSAVDGSTPIIVPTLNLNNLFEQTIEQKTENLNAGKG